MNDSPTLAHGTRTSRLAFAVLAACISVSVVAALALGHAQTRRAAEMLTAAEGISLLQMAAEELKSAGPPPRIETLEAVLVNGGSLGLRYVAVIEPGVGLVAEAGTTARSLTSSDWEGPPLHVAWVAGRARMVERLGRPRVPEKRTQSRPADALDETPPRVLVEFEPVLAAGLTRSAKLTSIAGAGLLLALVALSVLAARMLRYRDALTRQLERDRHLSSLGEMSAVLAHEIRNPLAGLKGHAQLLAESLPENSHDQKRAQRVVSDAVRLEALTADLLAFARSGRLELSEVDPAELLCEVAGSFGQARIHVDVSNAPPRWRLDPTRMEQVLVNIIENAVHASRGAPIDARIDRVRDALCVEIRDRGKGISPGEEERIFEPFHTEKAQGTGLGLAVARRIVSLHGGEVTASNHAEGGALFRITLPRDT